MSGYGKQLAASGEPNRLCNERGSITIRAIVVSSRLSYITFDELACKFYLVGETEETNSL